MEDPEDPFLPTLTSFLPFFDIKSDEGGEDVGCRGKTRPEASPPPLWQRDRSILNRFWYERLLYNNDNNNLYYW